MNASLETLVAEELATPVDPRAASMAAAIAAQYPQAARAVLFYGSCLREKNLDGLMLDFYLIVSDYRAAYGAGWRGAWLAWANRAIPPNVFPFEWDGMAAKYAVLSEADFARLCGSEADNVSVWARFAQPSRLVWAADDAARERVVAAVMQAAPTLLALAIPAADAGADVVDLWRTGFAATYKAELRAERTDRSGSIVDADPARYRQIGEAAVEALDSRFRGNDGKEGNARTWRSLQRRGKWLSVIRIAKASFTFAGGIDYLAWKINRHAGTKIAITPWQRRHPLLAAVTLLPRLLRSGAVR